MTVIMTKLKKITVADHGVKQLKRALLQGMEERFDEMEEKEMYALATYLDPRYKGFFFQNPENASTAKQKIAEKLEKLLLEDPSFQNVDGQASMNMENESPLGMEDEPSEPKKAKTTLSDTKAEIMKRIMTEMMTECMTQSMTEIMKEIMKDYKILVTAQRPIALFRNLGAGLWTWTWPRACQ